MHTLSHQSAHGRLLLDTQVVYYIHLREVLVVHLVRAVQLDHVYQRFPWHLLVHPVHPNPEGNMIRISTVISDHY